MRDLKLRSVSNVTSLIKFDFFIIFSLSRTESNFNRDDTKRTVLFFSSEFSIDLYYIDSYLGINFSWRHKEASEMIFLQREEYLEVNAKVAKLKRW